MLLFCVYGMAQTDENQTKLNLSLRISIQRDTIWIGEPILMTAVLINKSSEPIYILPASADAMQIYGIVGQILVEQGGNRRAYKIGIQSSIAYPLPKSMSEKIMSGDSIYWRKLLWLENFGSPINLEDFSSGLYKIIYRYFYATRENNMQIVRETISDSISFILAQNPIITQSIHPIRDYLKNLFWWNGGSIDGIWDKGKCIISRHTRAESLYQFLMKIKNINTPFTIYAEYLLPTVAGLTSNRKVEAVALADTFMKKYQGSFLDEEMAFWRGRLLDRAQQDSKMNEWLKPVFNQYPKNLKRYVYGNLEKSLK